MLKYLVPSLLIIVIFACQNQPITDKACDCEGYYLNTKNQKFPLLEFQSAYSASDIGGFLNQVMSDSLFFEDTISGFTREEFLNTFRININQDYKYENSSQIAYVPAKDTAAIMNVLSLGQKIYWKGGYPIRFVWSKDKVVFQGDPKKYCVLYAINTEAADHYNLTNKEVASARTSENPLLQEIEVSITMTEEGTETWGELTSKNVGNFIAIISQNRVLSAPIISGPITKGETLISGDFKKKEANELVHQINCSALVNRKGTEQFEQDLKDCK